MPKLHRAFPQCPQKDLPKLPDFCLQLYSFLLKNYAFLVQKAFINNKKLVHRAVKYPEVHALAYKFCIF